MARQAPESVPPPTKRLQRAVGIYGSYYKLFCCSDGKYRVNLISKEEYLESKKQPISVCDVTSSTTPTPSTSSSSATLEPDNMPVVSHFSNPVLLQQRPRRHRDYHCVPEQPQNRIIKRQRAAVHHHDADDQSDEGAHQTPKRQKRDRALRSTVAVADLIAEYIPVGVPTLNPIQEPTASSSCVLMTSRVLSLRDTPPAPPLHLQPQRPSVPKIPLPSQPGSTQTVWNNWIQSVHQRFPMAGMSVREYLDVLDRRPEVTSHSG